MILTCYDNSRKANTVSKISFEIIFRPIQFIINCELKTIFYRKVKLKQVNPIYILLFYKVKWV